MRKILKFITAACVIALVFFVSFMFSSYLMYGFCNFMIEVFNLSYEVTPKIGMALVAGVCAAYLIIVYVDNK